MATDPPAPDPGALRRYPPDDCDHGQTHCSDCDLSFEEHRRPDDYPGREFPMTDERCMDALIREAGRLQGIIDAQAARLAAARNALVVLYELNEAGNVGGAVYEEAMDLAMDVLRDTETATGAVGAGEGHDGD